MSHHAFIRPSHPLAPRTQLPRLAACLREAHRELIEHRAHALYRSPPTPAPSRSRSTSSPRGTPHAPGVVVGRV